MQTNPSNPVDAIRDDYDKWHEQMRSADGSESPLKHPWYESVYRELRNYPGGRLLEVGCGRGGWPFLSGGTFLSSAENARLDAP